MERKKILIAAPNTAEIQAIRQSLLDEGYDVRFTEDGSEALTLGREFRPHLLICNLALPRVDGHHLLREVKSGSTDGNVAFVIISEHRSVEERVHSIDLGCDEYLTAPFEVDEVLCRLKNLLHEIEVTESLPQRHEKAFSGKLTEMNLLDLLRTLDIGKKTATVHVFSNHREGIVYIEKGQIRDVRYGDASAREALFHMICWEEGSFQVELSDDIEQPARLHESTEHLFREAALFRDRWLKISKHLPPLETAVKLGQKAKTDHMTATEKTLLNRINGKTRLIDILESGKLDDLSTLRMLVNLYDRGSLIETPLSGTAIKDANERSIASGSNGYVSDLISNFLDPESEEDRKKIVERRKGDRRKVGDRRVRSRRWSDFVASENQVHLNKSELVMMREKIINSPDKIGQN